ncbi:2-hydroxyacid dehydrogenase [Loktanella sp. D2R18]|uniref:2-hydroxyacid dehydrogenase n=1 Tax=Rhodobacterales TaxID=204455 RepID=UPI000DE97CD3|nr:MULTISPECIES: 2-hydroxyacid dehydrogenase [Rhodobacterales]MDO6589409.1 2-hydroxyacid dehydrogenase [Yoonia sp. 1_MG-2023]RBW45183.1 2-hydroxyacid dehydrogenase [Loktanella sp. D2R18]
MSELLILSTITDHMRSRIEAAFDATVLADVDQDAWLAQYGADVRFILTGGHLGVPADIFARLPNAEIISSNGVGYDGVDTDAATARGVPVCHTPNVLNQEVATTALMLYIAALRNFEAEIANARSGNWEKSGNLPLARSADQRKIGILGLGRIGKAIAAKLAPFDPTIVYYGRSQQDVPFPYYDDLVAMARDCDALICVAPGGAATHHLIDRAVMDALGPEGVLINVGRGSVVDEAALIAALQEGRLGTAALDVFDAEPHIPAALRALPNVILTPHIGSATVETRHAMGDLAIDNLIAWKNGQPLISPVPESAGLL